MGYGSYTGADWAKLRASAKISESSSANELFRSIKCDDRFNPGLIDQRLSLDSEDHPNSTPVILGLDVTGSMGYLSAEIARNGLNETMMKIYSTNPISDPQLMFAAIGDVCDAAPLQVTQFESDIRIAEQLMDLWLEGRGGDSPEDFELIWYFAAKHTKTDCFDKHGKKGFIITIGDADLHSELSAEAIDDIFKDKSQTVTSAALAKEASLKYELFHITLNDAGLIPSEMSKCIPGRIAVIAKSAVSKLPEVIISLMQYANGMKKEDILRQWSDDAIPVVESALAPISFNNSGAGISF